MLRRTPGESAILLVSCVNAPFLARTGNAIFPRFAAVSSTIGRSREAPEAMWCLPALASDDDHPFTGLPSSLITGLPRWSLTTFSARPLSLRRTHAL